MSLSVRFYLFADDGLQRISQRLMHGLALGNDAMPQYAGTKQKAADVIVEVENGKPIRIAKADGNFLTFVKPTDVLEGMMAAQLFASHAAAMDCYRRAMLPAQTDYGREMNLTHAAKLTRANAAQVEALAKHRNKGRQKITIEHVHVYEGGQAIVGNVTPRGVGKNNEVQPHAVTYAPGTPMRCENPQGLSLSIAGDAERALPNARGTVAGSA
jgi:hypothetical protein